MQNGDTLQVRLYDTVLASGNSRVVYEQTYADAQPADDMIAISVPLPSDVECHMTIKQTAGTGRAFPWKVLSL